METRRIAEHILFLCLLGIKFFLGVIRLITYRKIMSVPTQKLYSNHRHCPFSYHITYWYNDKKYETDMLRENLLWPLGKRTTIIFNPKHPEKSYILIDEIVCALCCLVLFVAVL